MHFVLFSFIHGPIDMFASSSFSFSSSNDFPPSISHYYNIISVCQHHRLSTYVDFPLFLCVSYYFFQELDWIMWDKARPLVAGRILRQTVTRGDYVGFSTPISGRTSPRRSQGRRTCDLDDRITPFVVNELLVAAIPTGLPRYPIGYRTFWCFVLQFSVDISAHIAMGRLWSVWSVYEISHSILWLPQQRTRSP